MEGDDDQPLHERPRIVVVDDSRDAADVLSTLLKVMGFDVRAAYSAADALALVRGFRPHCVLSDIEMPDRNGYQLAEMIRQEQGANNLVLIAHSGNYDPHLAEAAGFNYHLKKPAPPLTLTDLLQRVLKMDSQLERAEKLIESQGQVVGEARDLVKEVKTEVQEIKHDLQDLKQDVKEIREDLKEIKAEEETPPGTSR
jgi:CheY-like chemotaxis protein